ARRRRLRVRVGPRDGVGTSSALRVLVGNLGRLPDRSQSRDRSRGALRRRGAGSHARGARASAARPLRRPARRDAKDVRFARRLDGPARAVRQTRREGGRMRKLAIVFLLLLSAGDDERAAIRKSATRFDAALNAGNAKQAAALFVEDGSFT